MKRTATILLVEDDKSMLDGMNDLLQVVDIGYEANVLTASNGLSALDQMQKATPDIIVSDIMMPQMDGFQLLKTVQQNPTWDHIPFIFLTARGEKHEIYKGRVSGAALYITKPFHSVELLELIKTQLDRKFQLEQTHEQSINNLKKDILQILNHEFRTPLTYVTAYYEMLAESVNTYTDAVNFSEYLRGIQAGYTRLTKLIDGFITVIELRTGEIEQKFQNNAQIITNVDQIVQDTLNKIQEQAAQKSIQVEYYPCSESPIIYGDPQALGIIFKQLLDNAVKFTAPRFSPHANARIRIFSKIVNNEYHLVIEDNGMGLPPAIQNRVFDLFVQYNRDQLEQQGAGIGLTIAQGLTELHQGRIEVKSVENQGSTFTVILPQYGAALAATIEPQPTRPNATILLVEDDQFLLEGLRELLEIYRGDYKLTIYTAVNGRSGLEQLEKNQPHLIISDIMMPHMDGYTFLEEVRKKPDWVQIPFIFLSAKGERRDIHRGLRSGVEEYITKPYNSDELLGLIVKQLNRYFRLRHSMSQDFEALKRSILDLITPDFRVPLTSVANYSEQLEGSIQQAQTDIELKKSLQGIQQSSIHLSSLIEDFIALAELKTGEAEMAYDLQARKIKDIGLLLYETSQLYASHIKNSELQLHCPVKNDLPAVIGDRDRLMNCIRRILDLGIAHTAPTAEQHQIILDATHQGNEIILSHQFPGQLSQDLFNHIEHFLKSDQSESGAAMQLPDLTIVHGYVSLHGGHMLVNNQPGFFNIALCLPIAQTQT
jgi:two-component system, sensor histidine kinase and response regulator